MDDRYEREPMLLLIESYALDVIGALAHDKEIAVSKIVLRTFGGDDWRETLRKTMGWQPDVNANLLANWESAKRFAIEQGIDPDPVGFAQMAADELSNS